MELPASSEEQNQQDSEDQQIGDQDTVIDTNDIKELEPEVIEHVSPKLELSNKNTWAVLLDAFKRMSYMLYQQANQGLQTLEYDYFIKGPLFDMPLSKINNARLKGKKLVYEKGDYKQALDFHLFRAYICLKLIDLKEVQVHSELVIKNKMKELEVKLLRLIYICLAILGQPYINKILQVNYKTIDLKSVLQEIAMEAYVDDVHNYDIDKQTQRVMKPSFKEYVIHQLEFLARMYQIDNAVSKMGLSNLKIIQTPSQDQQLEAYKQLLPYTITKKDQIFHIVSVDWFNSWTLFIQHSSNLHPGPINNPQQLQKLCVDNTGPKLQFLPFCDDFMNNLQIKDEVKEGQDYVIMNDVMFTYIYQIYGGTDIRRLSVKIKSDPSIEPRQSGSTDDMSAYSGCELVESKAPEGAAFEVEVNLRRIKILITPNQEMFPKFSRGENPFTVYVTKTMPIGVLQHKILLGLINQSKSNQHPISFLLNWSRMWKVDWSTESYARPQDLQKHAQDCFLNYSGSLPIDLHGKVLLKNQVIDELDIMQDEVLMYEVRILVPQQQLTDKKSIYIFTEATLNKVKQKKILKNRLFQEQVRPEQVEEEIEKRMRVEISSVLVRKSKAGLVGFQNLGNTCFMNSILQCVSNSEDLVKYFLFDVYQFHLNQNSVYGARGKLAIAYSDLLTELYVGENKDIAPWDIKRIISQKASQFMGFQQHDSQEFLSILLETLHEDVNSIFQKPYVQYQEYSENGKTRKRDEQIANEYWAGFKKREQSIFIDLFYGQLKSKLTCTKCGYSSLTYDPFNVLSLPIPTQKNMTLSFKYIPAGYSTNDCECIEFSLIINEFMTIFELKKRLTEYFHNTYYVENPEKQRDWLQPFISVYRDKKDVDDTSNSLSIKNDEKFLKNIMSPEYQLLAHEREPFSRIDFKTGDKMKDFVLIELSMFQMRKNYVLFNYQHQIGFPKLHVFRRQYNSRQVRVQIFKILRPLLEGIPKLDQFHNGVQLTETQYLEREFHYVFTDPNTGGYDFENSFYDVRIKNNLPKRSKIKCEFCQKIHSDDCLFDFGEENNETVTIDHVLGMISNDRELELTIQWKPNAKANLAWIENQKYRKVQLDPSENFDEFDKHQGNSNTSIYDCLQRFSLEEVLSGEDKWYCSRCNQHVSALKKIQIYKLPEYLIIHFKRFSHQRANQSRKITKTIDFPIENLDMSDYCKEQAREGKVGTTYSLYAVSNHVGSLSGGHYTAFCKNPMSQQWHLFDDRAIAKVQDKKHIVGSAAYVLFYKLNS